ncbi:hypothetical protein VaNZ11_004608 [Volvox africanus]|uniref:ABM domain-containing protein n=1 Tax=Volvox africanus TaxID=51714 RepID=A0ABQ5RYB1_9CHLO|nr:hypothetical protein VaNZ11_004608 [Volvox africanus]
MYDMIPKGLLMKRSYGTVNGKWPRGPVAQRHRRLSVAQSGRGPTPSSSDDPLKNLDLKSLNDLPLSKLSETANAVWERIRSSGLNVKVNPSSSNSQLLSLKLVPGAKTSAVPLSNGSSRTPDMSDLALSEKSGSGKEQRLMAALAQAQEEKRQLADRAEVLHANMSMLETKNAKMAREVECAEAGRANALKLRDMLLDERDSLAAQLKEAQNELRRASEGMEVREGALEALRQSQLQLQDELKDAVARLQAVDKSTEELRSQLAALEGSRAAVANERDDLASHLRDLMGRVEHVSGLFSGEFMEASGATAAVAAGEAPTGGGGGEGELSRGGAAAQLEQLRATTEGAFAALRMARSELGVLRSENQHLAQRAETLTSSNRELVAMAAELKQQVTEARSELDEQQRETAELRNREAALKMELTEAVSERQAAVAAVAAAEAQRNDLATAVAQLTAIRDAVAASGLSLVELAKMAVQLTTLKDQLANGRASEVDLKRRLATAEVALLDNRRAAVATEARMVSELEAARRDAAELRSALHARTLATQATRRAGVPLDRTSGQLINTNRFWVPADVLFDFVKAVAAREVALVEAKGFLDISVHSEEHNVMVVSTHWNSPAAFEAWSRSAAASRHHYPAGVYQYAPRRGEGVPEDYLPFKDVGDPARAKH